MKLQSIRVVSPRRGVWLRVLTALCLLGLSAQASLAGVDRWTESSPPADAMWMALGNGVLYATTVGGLYRTFDAGQTWSLVGSPPPPPARLVITVFVVDPATPTTLYGNAWTHGVLKSLNAGATWFPSGSGLPEFDFAALAIDPADPSRLFAGTSHGIYLSTDHAASWSQAFAGVVNVQKVVVDPADSSRVYAIGDVPGQRGAVLASRDRGKTWQAGLGLSQDAAAALAIDPTNPSNVYLAAGCCAAMWKSSDFGGNWTKLLTPLGDGRSVVTDPVKPGVVYLGGSPGATPSPCPFCELPTGVFRSVDGAATWTDFNAGLPVPGFAAQQLLVDPARRFLLELSSNFKIYTYTFSPQELAIPTLSPWGSARVRRAHRGLRDPDSCWFGNWRSIGFPLLEPLRPNSPGTHLVLLREAAEPRGGTIR